MSKKAPGTPRHPSGEASMLIDAVILCDQVRREDSSKYFFIGVYSDLINVSRLPHLMNMTIAVQVRVIQAGTFRFALSITDPLQNLVVEGLAGEGKYDGEEGRTAWLIMGLPPFVMTTEGEYVVNIDIEGCPARSERFQVRKMIQPTVQVVTSAPN